MVHNLIKRNDVYMKAKSKNLETDANLCHRLVTLCYSREKEASVINCDHLYTRDIWVQPNIKRIIENKYRIFVVFLFKIFISCCIKSYKLMNRFYLKVKNTP